MPVQAVRIYAALVLLALGLQLAPASLNDDDEAVLILRGILSLALFIFSIIILGNF